MSKPTYLLVGDTHGSLPFVKRAIAAAEEADVTTLLQLGDFGFLWPGHDQLARLHRLLEDSDVTMKFLCGNHDDHPALARVNWSKYPRLTFMQRGWRFEAKGVSSHFLGGAASIDQESRTEGKDWWASEEITDEQVALIKPCDVLFTHEAPTEPPGLRPWPGGISVRMQAKLDHSRSQIRRAMERAQPRLLVHGHYHFYYERVIGDVKVVGLAADGERGSVLLVDERFEPC